MKKCNKPFSIFTLILLFSSFLFAPVNLVIADEAGSEKTSADSGKDTDKKDADKKKKEKGKGKKGKDGEEPDCE